MFVLVCYDIADVAGEGAARLRRVADACKDYGVRAQYSVFECRISESQWVALRHKLLGSIDSEKDSLRFYFVCERDVERIENHGAKKGIDPTGLLLV